MNSRIQLHGQTPAIVAAPVAAPVAVAAKIPARRFLRDQDGAVTIDWIALTAAMVFLGIATGFFATTQVPQLAAKVDSSLGAMSVMPH